MCIGTNSEDFLWNMWFYLQIFKVYNSQNTVESVMNEILKRTIFGSLTIT